jgi:hypothetical protein
MRALDRELNQAILALAPPFEARPIAPAGLADLTALPHMIVWDGASDATIYGDARVNHAFRAWHDACHVDGQFPLTLAGERAACEFQIGTLLKRFPLAPARWLHIIRAEIVGQAEHYAVHGEFPADQAAFFATYGA